MLFRALAKACATTLQEKSLHAGAPVRTVNSVTEPWPEPRFEILHTGVLDRLTRLLWRRRANITPQPMIWRDALAAVAELNHKGEGNAWRLPTINELEALVDCAAHSPALPSGHPFVDVKDIYWSSTTSLFKPDWAWALYMEKGATGVGQKRFAQFSVWAVTTFD